MKKRAFRSSESRALHTHRSEQMLIEHFAAFEGDRVLCTTQGRAQFAAVATLRKPDREVTCHFLDLFRCEESQRLHGDCGGRLHLVCTADFPEGDFDVVALPFTKTGESELVREFMQTGHQRLVEGGRLAVSTDNADDSFFHEEMQKLFAKVTRIPDRRGVVYVGMKRGPLKRVRDFSSEFAFRDGERLLKIATRPGVFSHRKLDAGTRALLEAVEISPGMKVLDIGCGAGPVAVALATRAEGVSVEAVDANPRALACTERNCEFNGVTAVRTHLSAAGKCGVKGKLDLAAGNPPYFSHFRIAELFVASAHEALKRGGRAVFVTKQPEWFEEHMTPRFTDITTRPVREYMVVSALKAE
ncbi:MAG: methyltransferase [Planctomycetota bacterium]|nr:methyltransferase [Planctomycetota bacterium]